MCFRSMLGPLRATDIHTPGLTLKLQKTFSLFRYVPRLSSSPVLPTSPGRVSTNTSSWARAQLQIPCSRRRVRHRGARPVGELATQREFTPVIDRTYALDAFVDAHRYVDNEHKRGNVVITVP